MDALSCAPRRTDIPSGKTVFFDNWRDSNPLPTPEQVKTASDRIENLQDRCVLGKAHVVRFLDMDLVVKWGPTVSITEGQTLWLLDQLGDSVPVPKVYGWCTEGDDTYVYTSYVDGCPLDKCWPSLTSDERGEVISHLTTILKSLRRFRQQNDDVFIGSVDGGPLHDPFLYGQDCGPFTSVGEYNDMIFNIGSSLPQFPDHPFFQSIREAFPANSSAAIVLTHTDLQPKNVLLSPQRNQISAIVDWENSGWYPEYREYLTLYIMGGEDSSVDWGDEILDNKYTREAEAMVAYESTGILV